MGWVRLGLFSFRSLVCHLESLGGLVGLWQGRTRRVGW